MLLACQLSLHCNYPAGLCLVLRFDSRMFAWEKIKTIFRGESVEKISFKVWIIGKNIWNAKVTCLECLLEESSSSRPPKTSHWCSRAGTDQNRDQNEFSYSNKTHSDHGHHPHQQLILNLGSLTALFLEVALSPGSVNGAHVIWLFPNQGKFFSAE